MQDQAGRIASETVISVLECKNREAVSADILDVVSKAGLCKQQTHETGALADTICPIMTGAVLQFVSDKAIPANWECSATSAKAKLNEAILGACKQIPVSK